MMNRMWDFIKSNLQKNECSILKEYNTSKCYTYLDLLSQIENIALKSDITSLTGIKCAILCHQNIETVKAILLCWRMGMVAIPLSLQYGIEHCRNIIDVVEPDLIISDNISMCEEFGIQYIFSVDNFAISSERWIEREEELQSVEIMLCTSGTTGVPKAIMFTAEAIQKNVELISNYFTVDVTDTILICRPIYHCAVLVGELLLSILVGANIIFYSGGFQPFIIANILRDNDITVMCGTPTIFKGLSDCLKHRNMNGRLKTIGLSGEYLLPKYAQDIRKSFLEAKIFNVYGLTEAGPRVSFLPCDSFDVIPNSVGQPLQGVEIRIDCKSDNNLSEMQVGEIWIKTPTIMLGYYKLPEATNDRFQGEWFNTGDVGSLDGDNNLYILGRSDDMLIKAGMNIYPQEIEKRILKIPEIREVLVYGIIVNGIEQMAANIVLVEKYKFESSHDIMQKLSQTLPDYMMPLNITIVESLPRNASGKVVRPNKKVRNIDDNM